LAARQLGAHKDSVKIVGNDSRNCLELGRSEPGADELGPREEPGDADGCAAHGVRFATAGVPDRSLGLVVDEPGLELETVDLDQRIDTSGDVRLCAHTRIVSGGRLSAREEVLVSREDSVNIELQRTAFVISSGARDLPSSTPDSSLRSE